MDRELSEDIIDLGEASTETKGPFGARPDETLGQIVGGLSDD
ncbi:benenodin family lasso peptide [Sphingomonas sp. DT-204]